MELTDFGHHFLVEVKGSELENQERDAILELAPLGIVLRKVNFDDAVEYPDCITKMATLLGEFQSLVGRDKIIVAINEEGGARHELPSPFTQFPTPTTYAKSSKKVADAISEQLLSVGVNLLIGPNANTSVPNLAPNLHPQEFSTSVDEVTEHSCLFSSAVHESGLLSCALDFPGDGSASSKGKERKSCGLTLQELEHRDIRPFAALIDIGAHAMRMSDALYESIDADYPAFMSSKLCAELLRKKLGFKGVIVSPELSGLQIERFYSIPEVMRAAFVAGCDIFHVADLDRALQLAQHLSDVKLIKAASEQAFDDSMNRIDVFYEGAVNPSLKLLSAESLAAHKALAESLKR